MLKCDETNFYTSYKHIYIWIQSYNNANININMQTNKNHKIRAKRDLYLKGDQEEVSWGFLNPKIYDPR